MNDIRFFWRRDEMALLFRNEALEAHQDKLHGETLRAPAPALRWLTGAAALVAAIIIGFAFWGQFTRKEHVAGYLAPTKGLIKIFTPQSGTVLEKRVTEGQAVKQGDVLLVISSERATASTHEAQAEILTQLRQRRDSLLREQSRQPQLDSLAASELASRSRGLELEIAQAHGQIELQQARVASAQRTVSRYEQLLTSRFISEATLQQKQEELLDQRNQLASLERAVTSLSRDMNAARTEQVAAGLKRDNNLAAIARHIAELEQQLTEGDSRRTAVLTAPADGTVTTIMAEVGQAANPNTPLLSILPPGAELEARLLVPTRAAGFIQPKQTVALRYQAFPYQRFGHHMGVVVDVGRTVVQPNESTLPLALQEPVYLVTVRLDEQQVRAYGQNMPLQAGMMLDADIHLDRRRLIEWVFDPLLSVTGRI
jgi:membrane fusion protein